MRAFPELVLLSQPARGLRADGTTDPKACQDGGNGGNRGDSGISQTSLRTLRLTSRDDYSDGGV